MEEIKKAIAGLSAMNAAIVNCCFAVIFLIFFFVLPLVSYPFGAATGADLLGKGSVWQILISLVIVAGAIAAGIWPLVKKSISVCIVCTLAIVFISSSFSLATIGLGVGAILNIIIVLCPWCALAWFRKGLPADFDAANVGGNGNIPTKK